MVLPHDVGPRPTRTNQERAKHPDQRWFPTKRAYLTNEGSRHGQASGAVRRHRQPRGSLSPCALGGHPEAERREHLLVNERVLYRLQIVLCQHPGEIGTADLM